SGHSWPKRKHDSRGLYAKAVSIKLIRHDELVVFTDGGSRGNPGPSASGVVILTTVNEIVEAFGKYLGTTTNNVAEFTALKLALEAAAKYQPKVVRCYMDSELLCKQLNGQYRVKNPGLLPIYLEIKKLAQGYKTTFEHVYREKNKLADRQVNLAIDAALGLQK
ncbi:MAG TPA: ribonuclease HI family protein, partial [Candidatus Saccharimonadales bacterium]|nr:ribonuclease HI family protein [Candidatus Saccharimonadales bacterium]